MTKYDAKLKGYAGGIVSGKYLFLGKLKYVLCFPIRFLVSVPYINENLGHAQSLPLAYSSGYSSMLVRVDLEKWSLDGITVMDLSTYDKDLTGTVQSSEYAG